MGNLIHLVGKIFGRLTVLRKGEPQIHPSGGASVSWIVVCSCSPSVERAVNGQSLRLGTSQSCGCLKRESSKQLKNIEGSRFGKLTVIRSVGKDRHGAYLWEAKCDCGNTIVRSGTRLRKYIKSCGCLKRKKVTKDLLGQRFGSLLVIEREGSAKGQAVWVCRCDCGNTTTVGSVALGWKKHCGFCQRPERRGGISALQVLYNQIRSSYKTGADRRGYQWELVDEEFYVLLQQNCHYCGAPPLTKRVHEALRVELLYNGIDRKDNSRSYTTDNVVPSCKICAYAKRDMGYTKFIEYLKKAGRFQLGISATGAFV